MKINPNTQLILTGVCLKYCASTSLTYKYSIYKYWSISNTVVDIQEKWYSVSSNDSYHGDTSSDFTVFTKLFAENPDTNIWRINLDIQSVSTDNGCATGSTSLIVFVNQTPKNGTCTISPTTGVTLSTLFTLNCTNWVDSDGQILKYSYYGGLLNTQMKIGLGYSQNGSLTTQLPQGLLHISVEITDNDGGLSFFNITSPVLVNPDSASHELINSLMSQILSNDPKSELNRNLLSGDPLKTVILVQAVSNSLNIQSSNDRLG